ncbi:lytic murein transglycosylase B [Pelomonas sp. SE-A7]|uniref:lytic murein transglycosylase B n=1 Tax=Pelomonas sp. SE-A7 TaxID=3054953 RepID=UPI00259CFAD1|nr:lytic murein transglycosylase B [Pelomonas sp. SE-A7]MDM4765671.1 lytic murein transglycosylase B [Pelomonas sp. SE-A7]
MTKLLRLLPLLALLALPPTAAAAAARKPAKHTAKAPRDAAPRPLGDRAAMRAFAADLAAREGFDESQLRQQLAAAKVVPAVQRLIMPAPVGVAKDWGAYRSRFIEARRLQAGLAFWAVHEAALARAEERFGVPAQVILGILGVETFYGRIMGGFSALDALVTLSFDFPKGRSDRSPFFRQELAELLILARREGVDPAGLKGSYAGALGFGQFMPGSWNRYALDFDGDGQIDLIGHPVDAIGSIANFLAQHGWQRGMATDYTLTLPTETSTRARLLVPDIRPTFSAAQMDEAGVLLSEAGRLHEGPLAVIELQMGGKSAPVYRAGTQNFYVLTRYNQSAYYAMAVIELGRELLAMRMMGAPPAPQPPASAASGPTASP